MYLQIKSDTQQTMSTREIHNLLKKGSKQNFGQSSSSQSQTNLLNQHQQGIKLEDESVPSFFDEISDIMRGFGDCDNPLPGSVLLIEKILQQQLKGILNDAIEASIRRKGVPNPTQIDFEFLMRKHPVRINRMRKHIKDMKLLRKILKMQAGRPLASGLSSNNPATGSYNSEEIDANDSEDETDIEIPEKFDEEKTRRLFRADRISQILNDKQYQEFNEARRTSFYCRHSEKMKQKFYGFLGISHDMRLPNICFNILAYLAHETIAAIVDYAILTRLSSENRTTDPFSRVTSSGASFGMLHLCPEVTQGRGLDGVKPITAQEIQEAIRRFNQITNKKIGFYRSNVDSNMRKYLAI